MAEDKDLQKYRDILEIPYPKSQARPPMPLSDRAAQFLPFAALTGYADVIKETARLTTDRRELDDSEKEEINRQILEMQRELSEDGVTSRYSITFFLADLRKAGGSYVTVTGRVNRIRINERELVMEEGNTIPVEDILRIES